MRRAALLLVALLALMLSTASAAPTFGSPKQLSGAGINSHHSRVDLDGLIGVAAWEQWTGGTAASARIFYSRTQDGGATWSPRKPVFPVDAEQHYPDVVVLGSRVYVVASAVAGSETQYQFRSSSDGGKTFGMIQTVGIGPDAAEILESSIRVAAHGNKVWLAYNDVTRDGWVRYSTNGGADFAGMVQLESSASVETTRLRIANDGNNVYVLSGNTDDSSGPNVGAPATLTYWLQKSTNGGQSFGPVQTIAAGESLGNAEIDAYGSRIGIAWIDETANATKATSSIDRGATFRPTQVLQNTAAASVDVSATAGRMDAVYGGPSGLLLRSLINRRATYGKQSTVTPGVLGQNGGAMVASSSAKAVFGWIAEKNLRKRVYVRTGAF